MASYRPLRLLRQIVKKILSLAGSYYLVGGLRMWLWETVDPFPLLPGELTRGSSQLLDQLDGMSTDFRKLGCGPVSVVVPSVEMGESQLQHCAHYFSRHPLCHASFLAKVQSTDRPSP